MKRIERIKNWFNEEYNVIETRRKRINRGSMGLFYIMGIFGIFFAMDFFEWWSIYLGFIDWATEPIANMFIGTWLELPFIICVLIELIILVFFVLAPGLYWLFSCDLLIDKEFIDNPERTEKWRAKKRKGDR